MWLKVYPLSEIFLAIVCIKDIKVYISIVLMLRHLLFLYPIEKKIQSSYNIMHVLYLHATISLAP
jgi:hypothetical protein